MDVDGRVIHSSTRHPGRHVELAHRSMVGTPARSGQLPLTTGVTARSPAPDPGSSAVGSARHVPPRALATISFVDGPPKDAAAAVAPGRGDAQPAVALPVGEAGGGVQQAVAQRFGSALAQLNSPFRRSAAVPRNLYRSRTGCRRPHLCAGPPRRDPQRTDQRTLAGDLVRCP